jgi:YidC/Oxa1 family membrane protein insertase
MRELIFCQVPFFISMFLAMKDLCNLPVPGMATEGFLWFADLSVADPYMILPVLASGGFIAVIEMGDKVQSAGSLSGDDIKNIMRGIAILGIPIMSFFPCG